MPTRITKDSSPLIDIIAKIQEQTLLKHITYESLLTDHELVGAIRKINCRKRLPRKIRTRNFARYNVTNFKDLRSVPWYQAYNEQNPNKAWNIFNELLVSVIDKTHTNDRKTNTWAKLPVAYP